MVSGKVISKEKQEVVDFATVYLKGTTYGCTTNEEGIYHLHAPAGKYTLVVSAIGYETIEKPITLVHGERIKVGSINSIFYFLHKAAEPFNCLEQDNLA